MMKYMTDKALLADANEQDAFRVIYERYWEALYKKALTRLANDADAQDAVQEIFISLWRNKNTVDASQNLSAYLFTALKYYIIKHVYRKAKKGIYVPLSVKELELTELTTEEMLRFKETQTLIAKEVAALPPRMQEVYQLSRIDNLPTAQIAGRLNISEQTVKNTLTAALKKLRQRLAHIHIINLFL